MKDRKILSEEELMLDYAEMTSFNFEGLDFLQVEELQRFTDGDEAEGMFLPQYSGNDLLDAVSSFLASAFLKQKSVKES